MMKLAGLGKAAAAAVLFSSIAFGASVKAEEVTEDQIKAARATIEALGVTAQFDGILPAVAERLKAQLIQASPNFEEIISSTVDAKALALAPRRGDLERESATIYAKTFTTEELQAIAAFYSSEAGQKLLRDGPIATREMVKAADIWGAGISRDLAQESDKEMEKLIGEKIKADPGVATTPAVETPQ